MHWNSRLPDPNICNMKRQGGTCWSEVYRISRAELQSELGSPGNHILSGANGQEAQQPRVYHDGLHLPWHLGLSLKVSEKCLLIVLCNVLNDGHVMGEGDDVRQAPVRAVKGIAFSFAFAKDGEHRTRRARDSDFETLQIMRDFVRNKGQKKLMKPSVPMRVFRPKLCPAAWFLCCERPGGAVTLMPATEIGCAATIEAHDVLTVATAYPWLVSTIREATCRPSIWAAANIFVCSAQHLLAIFLDLARPVDFDVERPGFQELQVCSQTADGLGTAAPGRCPTAQSEMCWSLSQAPTLSAQPTPLKKLMKLQLACRNRAANVERPKSCSVALTQVFHHPNCASKLP